MNEIVSRLGGLLQVGVGFLDLAFLLWCCRGGWNSVFVASHPLHGSLRVRMEMVGAAASGLVACAVIAGTGVQAAVHGG